MPLSPSRYRSRPRRAAAVEAYLNELGNPSTEAIRQKLDEAAFVHFMSMWAVGSDESTPNHIIIEMNADGTVEEVTAKLAETMGPEISGLFDKAGIDRGGEGLATFLAKHHQGVGQGWFSAPGVNFDGTPQLTVGQIRREAELAYDVAEMLDTVRGKTALATLDAVRERLWNDDARKWAFVAAPAPSLDPLPPSSRAILPIFSSLIANFFWPLLAAAAVVLIVVWVLGGFALAAWITLLVLAAESGLLVALYLALRRAEQTDIPDDLPPAAERVAEYMKREGHAAQSHLAAASILKPGALRHLTLRLGLWFAGILAAYFSRPGFLGSTGVIHFARWILLPGTNKLLFMSNYDGVWESYLEDFIERASQGVTGIWSNTVGFPKSENLIFKGANDGDRLRRWTRRQQRTTWFWYTAYPDLTLNRIRVNAAIRQGISQAKSEADAADWLSCFGSEPTLPGTLETERDTDPRLRRARPTSPFAKPACPPVGQCRRCQGVARRTGGGDRLWRHTRRDDGRGCRLLDLRPDQARPDGDRPGKLSARLPARQHGAVARQRTGRYRAERSGRLVVGRSEG